MKRRRFLKLGFTGATSLAVANSTLALEYYPKKSDKELLEEALNKRFL